MKRKQKKKKLKFRQKLAKFYKWLKDAEIPKAAAEAIRR